MILEMSSTITALSAVSSAGNCHDNAAMESFFGLLKREWIKGKKYLTRDEARVDVFGYRQCF
jgi:putative transposase